MATLVCLAVLGGACSDVDGGAVELSWKLRPASSSDPDKFVDCASGKPGTRPVTAIRLDWTVGDDMGFDEWPCSDNSGVTRFALPPGTALLSVSPRCAEGAAALDTYIAPAPEQRNVILGDTVSLGAVEIVVVVSYCDDQPCICQ
ncbi:MAG: hypothetical protein KF773_04595 [Deltaproteobacteria bacterium]|nr:hypothetical protein [Deltaproteobacteria bacterium]